MPHLIEATIKFCIKMLQFNDLHIRKFEDGECCGWFSVNDDGSLTFDKNRGMVLGVAHVFNERLRSSFSFSANKGKTATTFDNKSL
ncbi:MAG: hypothetical protein ACK5SZ_00110, partial [bacterium]